MLSMSSKCLPFNISFLFGNRKKSLGARSGEQGGCSSTVICLLAKNSLANSALIQTPTFSRRYTETHSDNNRRHSERDWHSSITTQLWNAAMPTSSNHTEVSAHCCYDKHTVASSRTLLSFVVYNLNYEVRLWTHRNKTETQERSHWRKGLTDLIMRLW
jgi:hypothetical protein